VTVPAALAPASPRSHVWHARDSVHRGRAAPHSCGPMLRIEGSSTISPQRRRDPISAGGCLGDAWNNTPDCCGWGGTPCRRCTLRSRRSSEPCALGAVVPRLRFPVVVSPLRGRWHALGVQQSGRSCEGAARAAIRLQSRRRAHSVRLGSDCADAAVDRQTCRCSWPYGVPDGDDWTWIDSESLRPRAGN